MRVPESLRCALCLRVPGIAGYLLWICGPLLIGPVIPRFQVMGNTVERCSLGRRRQCPWEPLRSQHMLRQSQKSYTVRGHHRRTGLREHGVGCPQVLAVRTRPPSCLAEVGEVISWRGILGRVEGFTREMEGSQISICLLAALEWVTCFWVNSRMRLKVVGEHPCPAGCRLL